MKHRMMVVLLACAVSLGGGAFADPQQTSSGGIGCEGSGVGTPGGSTCGAGGETYGLPPVGSVGDSRSLPGEGQPTGACHGNTGVKIVMDEFGYTVATPGMTAGSVTSPEARVKVILILPFVRLEKLDLGDISPGTPTSPTVSPRVDPRVVSC